MSVILVTGSSTGIGQETALHLARQGHEVYASVRNPDGADELKEKIAAENLPASVIRLDLVDPASVQAAVDDGRPGSRSSTLTLDVAGCSSSDAKMLVVEMPSTTFVTRTSPPSKINSSLPATWLAKRIGSLCRLA